MNKTKKMKMMYNNEARGLAIFFSIFITVNIICGFLSIWLAFAMEGFEILLLIAWGKAPKKYARGRDDVILGKMVAEYLERHPEDKPVVDTLKKDFTFK